MRRRRSLWLAGGCSRGAGATPGGDGVGIRCPEGISRRWDIPAGEGVGGCMLPGVGGAPRLLPPANHRERLRRTRERAPRDHGQASPRPGPPLKVRGTRYVGRGTRYGGRGTRYEVRGTRYEVRGAGDERSTCSAAACPHGRTRGARCSLSNPTLALAYVGRAALTRAHEPRRGSLYQHSPDDRAERVHGCAGGALYG